MGYRSLLDHPAWLMALPNVRIQRYDREGGHEDPRRRLEVYVAEPWLRRVLLSVEVDCARCGRPIPPIRERAGPPGSFYLAVTCEQDTGRYGCCRSKEANEEMQRLIASALAGAAPPRPRQAGLF